jgi:hypothetical protein
VSHESGSLNPILSWTAPEDTPAGVETETRFHTPSGLFFAPDVGPSTRRSGDFSDVTRAIYQLPTVEGVVERVHEVGLPQLRFKSRDIPVPDVEGLSFQILDRGGSLTVLLGHGFSGTGRLQFPGDPTPAMIVSPLGKAKGHPKA